MRPIRQPGGYYSDCKVFSPTLVLPSSLAFEELVAKKTDKLSVRSPSPFHLPPALLLSHWGYPIVPVSLTEPGMSNWVTMAWPVPTVTLGTCLRATASLPHSHTATLLTTFYVISGSLGKIIKRAFLKNREALHQSWAGCQGPCRSQRWQPLPLPCLLWQEGVLQPLGGEKNSTLGTVRDPQVNLSPL